MKVDEYTKIHVAKYTDAHIVPEGQEIPLEIAEWEEYVVKRTFLDEMFDHRLQKSINNFSYINKRAIEEEHPDIKSQSCYIVEILETILSNRENQSSPTTARNEK